MTTKTTTKTKAGPELLGGPCKCGCGQQTQRKTASFVRGHDSRLVRQYRERVEAGELTKAQAVREVGKVSPTLGKKLARFIDNRAAKAKEAARAKAAGKNGKAAAKPAPKTARKPAARKPPEPEPETGPGDPAGWSEPEPPDDFGGPSSDTRDGEGQEEAGHVEAG